MKKFVAFFLLSVAVGCNYDSVKSAPDARPGALNFKASDLTFQSVYFKILRPHCVSCHGHSGDVNLETYASVKSNIDQILRSTIVERKMPKRPTPPLSEDQRNLLQAWIQIGAPESHPDESPLPPLVATFESIKTNILEPKCLMCHAPGQPVERLPLVTREDLLDSPEDIVIAGNAPESGLILAVTGANPKKIMPPLVDKNGKPTGFSVLSEMQIQIISDWINRGAKD